MQFVSAKFKNKRVKNAGKKHKPITMITQSRYRFDGFARPITQNITETNGLPR